MISSRRSFIKKTSVTAFAGLSGISAPNFAISDTVTRPNVLFVITDDQSWLHTGAYGDPVVKTPAFDFLSSKGVRFNHAYTSSPSCTPSRGAILTGQDMWRLQEGSTLFGALPNKLPVFPMLLEQSGYFVGSTGKAWGPGSLSAGGWGSPPTGKAYNNIKCEPPQQQMNAIDYAENFNAFLQEKPSDQPFCFWFGSFEPHRKYEKNAGINSGKSLDDVIVPDAFPDRPEVRRDILDYYNEIEYADSHLQKMLDMLEQKGELKNTIIIATSDNGMPFPRAKGNLYDLGVRMPMVISWQAMNNASYVCEDMVSTTDIAPTILNAAGIGAPAQMTGGSLLYALNGESDSTRDMVVCGFERHTLCRPGDVGYPMRLIRTKDMAYIHNYEPNRYPAGGPGFESIHQGTFGDIDNGATKQFMIENSDDPDVKPFFELGFLKRPAEELYEMNRDPFQISNLADLPSYKSKKQKLKERMELYLTKSGDPRMRGENPWDSYVYHHRKR